MNDERVKSGVYFASSIRYYLDLDAIARNLGMIIQKPPLQVKTTSSDARENTYLYLIKWLWTYNNERPNMGIGDVTPAMKLAQAAKGRNLNQTSTSIPH